MKSDVIVVSANEDKISDALTLAEKVAAYKELSPKSALHLRLLTEEVMSMVHAITGDVEGDFWIEDEGNVFKLHLQVRTNIDEEQREKLLSASKSGKNEATKGIMGKIRAFFEPLDGLPVFYGEDMGMLADAVWSMRAYQEQVRKYIEEKRDGADEAWDELEKSVIFHIADDVKVSIYGRDVELTVIKEMA